MKKLSFNTLVAVVAFVMTGCVSTVPVNYAPSSTMSASGNASINAFTYLPAVAGKVTPNQVRNTAIGSVKFEQNVDVLVRDAVFKELKFMGVKVEPGQPKEITGEIEEFLIDDLGYSIDWTLRIKYKVTSAGAASFEGVKEVKRKTSKFANPLGALNETIKLNIEELVKDPIFLQAIK